MNEIPGRFRLKADVEVSALQIARGRTTKADILAFCPDANVGVPALPGGADNPSSTDLHWVAIPTDEGVQDASDGDWIVKVSRSALTVYLLMYAKHFPVWFELIEGEQHG